MTCRELIEYLPVLQVRSAVADIVRMTSRFAYVTTTLQPSSVMWWHNKCLLRLMFVLEARPSRPDLKARMDWAGTGHVLVLQKFRD